MKLARPNRKFASALMALGLIVAAPDANAVAEDGCIDAATAKAISGDCGTPLQIHVGLQVGGSVDSLAREFSDYLWRSGVKAIVVNRSGASGNIAAAEFIRNHGNDCKFMMAGPAQLYLNQFSPTIRPKIDPRTQYQPVGLIATAPMFLVVNTKRVPEATSIEQFYKKAAAGMLFYGAPVGSSNHIVGIDAEERLGTKPSTHVPTRGTQDAAMLLLTDSTDFMFDNPAALATVSKYTKIRILANTSGRTVNYLGQDIPPISSYGPLAGLQAYSSFGLVANAHASAKKVAAMETAVACFTKNKELQRKVIVPQGYQVQGGTAAELAILIGVESAKYESHVKKAFADALGENDVPGKPEPRQIVSTVAGK